VDVPVLNEAAAGLIDSINDQEGSRLADAPGGPDLYGDGDLHAAITEFCDRWSFGLDVLTDDARAIADSLRRAAGAYLAADTAAATRVAGDPGVAAVDD
jgi:hypothetical protein